jgi:excisionase family DNA binding protein
MDEIFTVDEAAARLKLNADTIRRLLRNEQLPGVKIGARE